MSAGKNPEGNESCVGLVLRCEIFHTRCTLATLVHSGNEEQHTHTSAICHSQFRRQSLHPLDCGDRLPFSIKESGVKAPVSDCIQNSRALIVSIY